MKWKVDIEFRNAPAVSGTFEAMTKENAKDIGREFARLSGWIEPIKKITARKIIEVKLASEQA